MGPRHTTCGIGHQYCHALHILTANLFVFMFYTSKKTKHFDIVQLFKYLNITLPLSFSNFFFFFFEKET